MPRKTTKNSKVALKQMLILERLPGYFLVACLGVAFYLLYDLLEPFVTVIFLAAVLAITFYPVYRRFFKWFKGWKKLSSFLTCLVVVLVILVPLTIFTMLLAVEANDTYQLIQERVEDGFFDKYLLWGDGGFFYDLTKDLENIIDIQSVDIKENIISWSKNVSSFLVDQTKNIAVGLSSFMISLVVMLFALFYFFKDGKEIVKKIGVLSPLPFSYEKELFEKIRYMVKSVVFGVFLTAILQGMVGGIGFAIAGISSPIFWGAAIAFFSLVPVVGTALIWVPTAIILFVMGDYGMGIFMVLWGTFAIGSVDNFARPFLIGGKSKTYPLLMFLVVLGGVITKGLIGVIIGPLVLVVLMSFLHIYEAEYKKLLKG